MVKVLKIEITIDKAMIFNSCHKKLNKNPQTSQVQSVVTTRLIFMTQISFININIRKEEC